MKACRRDIVANAVGGDEELTVTMLSFFCLSLAPSSSLVAKDDIDNDNDIGDIPLLLVWFLFFDVVCWKASTVNTVDGVTTTNTTTNTTRNSIGIVICVKHEKENEEKEEYWCFFRSCFLFVVIVKKYFWRMKKLEKIKMFVREWKNGVIREWRRNIINYSRRLFERSGEKNMNNNNLKRRWLLIVNDNNTISVLQ